MVYTVSENAKKEPSAGSVSADTEAQWETGMTTSMLPRKTRKRRATRCCIVLPWCLFILSLLLMGCVAYWGWKEHFKLQDALADLKAQPQLIDKSLYIDEDGPNDLPRDPIPYGNDGLFAVNPLEQMDVDEEIVEFDSSTDADGIAGAETKNATAEESTAGVGNASPDGQESGFFGSFFRPFLYFRVLDSDGSLHLFGGSFFRPSDSLDDEQPNPSTGVPQIDSTNPNPVAKNDVTGEAIIDDVIAGTVDEGAYGVTE